MPKIADKVKEAVLTRYNGRCSYCGLLYEQLTLDHIKPRSKGGHTRSEDNLTPACYDCNNAKSDLSVEEFRNDIMCNIRLLHYNSKLTTPRSLFSPEWKRVIKKFAKLEAIEFWIDNH